MCSQSSAVTCEIAVGGSGTKSQELSRRFRLLLDEVDTMVINQRALSSRIMVALLTGGHVLVEGPTGGGKTTLVKTISQGITGTFKRTQFTPDTTPSELTGVSIYDQVDKQFKFHPGSLFGNVVHADEINRAIPRTQSALLEGMEEGHVTVAGETRKLPDVFLIMATQNPGSQVGTFPLPEAQLDRFLFKLLVSHSEMDVEKKILQSFIQKKQDAANGSSKSLANRLALEDVVEARKAVLNISMPDEVQNYILRIIDSTRNPISYSARLTKLLNGGVGPRATFALELGARGIAWIEGKSAVEISDVNSIVRDVLRHRLFIKEEALSEGITPDMVIEEILRAVSQK